MSRYRRRKSYKGYKSTNSYSNSCRYSFWLQIALQAIESGVDKVRINPGNIGDKEKVKAVVDKWKEKHIPIRIGVNGGSLEKDLLEKYGKPTAEAMVESAKKHIDILEELGFKDYLVSLKA